MLTRRSFLEVTTAVAAAGDANAQTTTKSKVAGATPWYRTAVRWGQTNITERDPTRYDIGWWREYWKSTAIQGVIINAGGIVAYYPSKFPLQHRAEFLNGRDLYGELVQAARQESLAVIARMDSNRTTEDFFKAHPDWFARKVSGEPYRVGDKYVTCVNSDYYQQYLPSVLIEIIERSHPDGFADNSWAGLSRASICYCENCARSFQDKHGKPLPRKKDWDDQTYRLWNEWNYDRRIEIWDLNNRTTKGTGGPNCLWLGMNSGSITAEANSFRDLRRICERSDMLLLDHQSRTESTGFQQNSDAGKLVHEMIGWDKVLPESMALYQVPSFPGEVSFRLSSKPPLEARMWMYEGIAGGIQPWWHHVGAYHEDRRMYHTAQPVFQWHKQNEKYLIDRKPVAKVGLVWSQRNTDYFGRDAARTLVDLPYFGFTEALLRARIPYVPVHVDDVGKEPGKFAVLILPNIGVLSDSQCALVRKHVEGGGSLIATGATSLFDEWGNTREDFALADLFGAHASELQKQRRPAGDSIHTYLRISPELRSKVWGPKAGDEPAPSGERHPIFKGFDETDILPFGGELAPLKLDSGVTVPLTFIPALPGFPPEVSWMRQPKTDIPGLVLKEKGKANIAYFPAEIDSRYGKDHLPDHANLLANTVRWSGGDDSRVLDVRGPGLLDCHLYSQRDCFVLHIINLSNEAAWKAPVEELIPVGPLNVSVKLAGGVRGHSAQSLVSRLQISATASDGWTRFEVPSVRDHEVIVIR
jgi:Hypothetical glycosyl hydrolase 6